MLFGVYTEIQNWPGKSPDQAYQEVIAQIINADRLGYDSYTTIEHFCFPKFSISTNPFALFAAVADRARRIRFRTLGHVLPLHNPVVLASQIAQADVMLGGRYEFGVLRGHGWVPLKTGVPPAETRDIYEESLDILFTALENERFSHDGKYYHIEDSHIVPLPARKFRVFLGGISNRTYELAGERGWGIAVPPVLPYEALKEYLDLYRSSCARHGTTPDIVWIRACYIDDDRATARREAERGMRGFLAGNASPLTDGDKLPPADVLEKAGYAFYGSGIIEQLAAMPYDEMIDSDTVWVGTPSDVIDRIETIRDVCEGLTEIAIVTNAGGVEHWQSIKVQEQFAHKVMPHFATAAR